MADKPWKRIEREKCRELGGERSGPTGKDDPDCTIEVRVALEIKYVKKYTFLTEYWEQAVENAAKVGLIPVLAIKEAKRGGRDCVQLRDEDWHHLMRLGGIYPASVVGAPELRRIPWGTFVRLYRAAYAPA